MVCTRDFSLQLVLYVSKVEILVYGGAGRSGREGRDGPIVTPMVKSDFYVPNKLKKISGEKRLIRCQCRANSLSFLRLLSPRSVKIGLIVFSRYEALVESRKSRV